MTRAGCWQSRPPPPAMSLRPEEEEVELGDKWPLCLPISLSCPLDSGTLHGGCVSPMCSHSGLSVPGKFTGPCCLLGAFQPAWDPFMPPNGGGPLILSLTDVQPGVTEKGRLRLRPQPSTEHLTERAWHLQLPSKHPALLGLPCFADGCGREVGGGCSPRGWTVVQGASPAGGQGPQGVCLGARPAWREAASLVQSSVRLGCSHSAGSRVLCCPQSRTAGLSPVTDVGQELSTPGV